MTTSEIRSRFFKFFEGKDHKIRSSSNLVPDNDPSLLFTNAGMVQFKGLFLGVEEGSFKRAVTSQKCLRAGGKHNDLEEVGRTARHHTFFEMLGNFSFGDYFKETAIQYAWEFFVDDLGLEKDRILVSIHDSDDEAHVLWRDSVGLPEERIFRLGDKDNFWQMADTGPCGPCSELHYDMRSKHESGALSTERFVQLAESGTIIELWNLVFMQFDRDEMGELHPLPSPSIDTGAGLERLAAVMQGADSNYHTDGFLPLIDAVSEVVSQPYSSQSEQGVSYRVLADHARAVSFLLADGVLPSNEGRGYVLRRILRRAGRHAWLLGRREPTLVEIVKVVIDLMSESYPDLGERREYITESTLKEEERFLLTIEGGMNRFEQITTKTKSSGSLQSVSGPDAFKLYDTFGFPLDLTQLMAKERGYDVDVTSFEQALKEQKDRSRADRMKSNSNQLPWDTGGEWRELLPDQNQMFRGYDQLQIDTQVLSLQVGRGRAAFLLADNPFYAEGGGQISDVGIVEGDGWEVEINQVVKLGERIVVAGAVRGMAALEVGTSPLTVRARVDSTVRCNTQRNHTATHLLHASLRKTLGKHVVQRGSLVTPDRLRFDFAHNAPMTDEECSEVEKRVNQEIWSNLELTIENRPYNEALESGAMALFGEKYSEVVRVVEIEGVSIELCGGTHVQRTGELGLFKIMGETGVAAGVRRIEACTGSGAIEYLERYAEQLNDVAVVLGVSSENVTSRVRKLLQEKKELETLIGSYMTGDQAPGEAVVEFQKYSNKDKSFCYKAVTVKATGNASVRKWGDAFLANNTSGVAIVGAELPGPKHTLFLFVTEDLVRLGIKANEMISRIAEEVGGRGGGKSHMAQAGVQGPSEMESGLVYGKQVLETQMKKLNVEFSASLSTGEKLDFEESS